MFGEGGAFKVLVIGDEPLNATYLPDLRAIVQWRYSSSEEELLQLVVNRFDSAAWEQGDEYVIDGGQVLFDCSAVGTVLDPDEVLSFDVDDGVIRIDTALVDDGVSGAVVDRLSAIGDTG